ncbi:MAG: hypothetical protein LUG86_01245 [Oscillospiraceae bacterium]|nr:hypothetical protein [Oscillospiraceae bacterium]
MNTIQNYEAPMMDIILFHGDVWDVITASSGTTKSDTKTDAILQSEAEAAAYE